MDKIKTSVFYRNTKVERVEDGTEGDSRFIDLAFSSEEPVQRFFGLEILDHGKDAVRLGRIAAGGPVLVNHDPDDLVGVVENVSIGADRVGRARVRFGKSNRADEIFQDVKDGIRMGVSVGYQIHKLEEVEGFDRDNGLKSFRAVDWEPLEVSLASVPADLTVGVGRTKDEEIETKIIYRKEEKKMEQKIEIVKEAQPTIDIEKIKTETRNAEQERVREIMSLGERFKSQDLAKDMISGGGSIVQMREKLLEGIEKNAPSPIESNPDIGLNHKEKREYSFIRAIDAAARQDWSGAGLEREASEAVAQKLGKAARGFFIPSDVPWSSGKRDLSVGTNTAGGFTKGTDHMGEEYVDALRNRLVVKEAGARILTGLKGDVAIPALNAKTNAAWVAEGASPTEGAPTFRQIAMSPKTCSAFIDISRRLMQQSDPSVDALLRDDMINQIAAAIDDVAIEGGASSAPVGVLQTSGIGDVAGGTNGLAPTWDHLVKIMENVDVANALAGNLSWLMNAKTISKLRRTSKVSSTDSVMILADKLEHLGYPILNTNGVPGDLTKGSGTALSAIIFGNFSDMLIGEWSGIDVLVDPYTGSTAGTIRIATYTDVDVAVRHAGSFSAMQDAVTV